MSFKNLNNLTFGYQKLFVKHLSYIFLFLIIISCKNDPKVQETVEQPVKNLSLEHAQGFNIEYYEDYKVIEVATPWPGAKKSFRYLLKSGEEDIPNDLDFDAANSIACS